MSKPLIEFQDVLRDGIQSLFGTNPSAQEIIDAYPTAHLTGTTAIQTGGGTFFDIFAKKGRNEWREIEKIITHFKKLGVKQSALIRGDFLFGYEPQAYDVIRAVVFEYAKMGINVLQNFHGMNDERCLIGVVKAVNEAKEKGYDIVAQGTICIEDNHNITINGCLEFAKKLLLMGHKGFYLKSASGRLNSKFVYELTSKLYDEFPDQTITIHAHSTYGEAPVCYIAAAKAAVERNKKIIMDVQHPALSGSTAHPSMNKMVSLIKNHPDKKIKSNIPILNIKAIKKSIYPLLALRFRYREFESSYNSKLVDAMYKARTPGGASATLKSIPGLVDTLGRLLGDEKKHADWDAIQIEIYRIQAEILKDLGEPTQVTPYAANTTGQAALSLWHKLEGRDKYTTLYPGIVEYLVKKHGRRSSTVKKNLIKKALEQAKLNKEEEYVLSIDRKNELPIAEEKLNSAGLKKPNVRQKISAAILKDSGQFKAINHIIDCSKNKNIPQKKPKLSYYAQKPQPMLHNDGSEVSRDIRDAVNVIGGYAKLQEIAERALHLKQLDDNRYIFPEGEENLKQEWFVSNIKKLIEILDSIPMLLENANFSTSQKMAMQGDWSQNNIHIAIKDSVDKKGKGLYQFMKNVVDKFRKDN